VANTEALVNGNARISGNYAALPDRAVARLGLYPESLRVMDHGR